MATRNCIAIKDSQGSLNVNVGMSYEEWLRVKDEERRKLFLYDHTSPISSRLYGNVAVSPVSKLIESILLFNQTDRNIPAENRTPIMLYISSFGGDMAESFALISAIELSKTPIYTVNVGKWSAESFWIGIAGHKRFALPNTVFLMHDGAKITEKSSNMSARFAERFEDDVIKKHILKHSTMSPSDYDAAIWPVPLKQTLKASHFYMLPNDALKYGFIDEIVTDIDDIL